MSSSPVRGLSNLRRIFIVEYVTKLTKSSNVLTAANTVTSRVTSLRTAGKSIQRRHPVIPPRGRIPRVRQKFLQRREIEDLHQWAPIEAVNTNTPAPSPNHPPEGEEPEEDPRGLEHFQRLAPWRGMVWKIKNHPLHGEILKLELNNHRSGSSGE